MSTNGSPQPYGPPCTTLRVGKAPSERIIKEKNIFFESGAISWSWKRPSTLVPATPSAHRCRQHTRRPPVHRQVVVNLGEMEKRDTIKILIKIA